MIVGSIIDLKWDELSEKEWRKLFTALTFLDAEQREIKTYRLMKGGRVKIPRGAWNLLPDHVRYQDRRVAPERRALVFRPILDSEGRTGQQEAAERAISEEQGIVVAQPGFGKTIVALSVVARVRTPWIVFVHTQDIYDQWIEYAQAAIPGIEIGTLQGQDWTTGDLTVAMVQTVHQQMARFRQHYGDNFGGVIMDEAHHSPAESWEIILNSVPAKYRLGFTATESRADGMQALMKHLIGPVIFRQKFKLTVPTRVVPIKSGFKFAYRGAFDWAALQSAIVTNDSRNQLIAETAVRQIEKGHSTLILSRRIEHIERISMKMQEMMADINLDLRVEILTGKTPKPMRLKKLEAFRAGEIMCLLSTQLMDEAVDVPILSRVFLTYPGKHDGRIIQQIGRALREHDDKYNAVIFDVVDDQIGVLRRQWMERKQTYDKLKIKVKKNKDIEERPPSPARKRREVSAALRKRMKGRR